MTNFAQDSAAIVLIEDNGDDAFFVRHSLENAHIVNPLVCFPAVDPAQRYFLNGHRPTAPALFIVDVQLAGGDTGIDFLRWLRQQEAPLGSTPTMMLSGSDRPADRVQAEQLRSIHFLHKPVTADTLTAAVQSLGFVITSLIGFTAERTIARRA